LQEFLMTTYLVGQRFGLLTVLARVGSAKNRVLWQCACDCGRTDIVTNGNLLQRGKKKSCGCAIGEMISAAKRTHGQKGSGGPTQVYRAWLGIKQRCLNPRYPDWHNYGGRGITVCERWADSFEAFYADVGDPPGPDLSIDRINNDGNYEPGNVRWATRSEQNKNVRFDKFRGERNGRTKLTEDDVRFIRASSASGVALAAMLGVTKTQISYIRLRKSWQHIS
jgi:hypothetical protein